MTIWLAEPATVNESAQKTVSPLVVSDGSGLRKHYGRLLAPDYTVVEASPEEMEGPNASSMRHR